MTDYAHPQRETYPVLTPNDTLVIVFRDHIVEENKPALYVKSVSNAVVRVDSGQDLDIETFSPGVKL